MTPPLQPSPATLCHCSATKHTDQGMCVWICMLALGGWLACSSLLLPLRYAIHTSQAAQMLKADVPLNPWETALMQSESENAHEGPVWFPSLWVLKAFHQGLWLWSRRNKTSTSIFSVHSERSHHEHKRSNRRLTKSFNILYLLHNLLRERAKERNLES